MLRTKRLAVLLALALASCVRSPQPQPERTPDAGGEATKGSENRSDASRSRTRT